ncbi:MAG: hypothetical protein ABFC57_14720 [Veillonellales bacterium]
MDFLLILLLLALAFAAAVWLFIAHQGDAEFAFLVDQRTDFAVTEINENMATFSCKVPFINKGTQLGTIMDAYTRHLLPYEQYDGVEVYSRLELESAPRTDGYFEALLVPKSTGQTVVITVKLTAKDGDIRQALADMVDMPVDIVYQVVARGNWYIDKARIVMKAAEIRQAAKLSGAAA